MIAEVAGLSDPSDLGEVAEMVEDRFGRPMLISQLVDAADWLGTHFNLVHLAIALMYAEGLLRVGFTANWDRLAQRAAWTIAGLDLSCPCDKPTLAVATPPLFVHMHGDAELPHLSWRRTGIWPHPGPSNGPSRSWLPQRSCMSSS
jgi:hypothetical protein